VGFETQGTAGSGGFTYFCALDPFRGPTDFRHELRVPAGTTVPEVVYFPVSDPTNERWIHVLFQVDSTQAVMDDRVKVWLGDAKVTAPFDNADVALNAVINLGTAPQNIQVGAQSTAAFGIVDAPAKIRAAWVKFASTSLFDFEVEANRRYFIGADLSYVTHQAAMGGQTADFWGAGAVSDWTGIGWSNSGGVSVTEGAITSIPGPAA